MASLSLSLVAISTFLLSAAAIPLERRQDVPAADGIPPNDGPVDGQLNHSWVIAVAASLTVIVVSVVALIVIIKWRQSRRRRHIVNRRRHRHSSRQNFQSSASDKVVAMPEQAYERVWKGPYASRASYIRSPSPPSPAHSAEKGEKSMPPKR